MKKYLFIYLHVNFIINISNALEVKLKQSKNVDFEPAPISKRGVFRFPEKELFSFDGLERIESVPVLFPIDICLMRIDDVRYAASLHHSKNGERRFVIFKKLGNEYQLVSNYSAHLAIAMDCIGMGKTGYVALVYNITDPIKHAQNGSPIYEINQSNVRVVQYFPTANLKAVYLRSEMKDLYLFHSLSNPRGLSNITCPLYIWFKSSFRKIKAGFPCSNAKRLEPFSIDHENYIAVANYADQYGRTATTSEIYKYNKDEEKFHLMHKIKTNGAVDVKYFSVQTDDRHFLIFANSVNNDPNAAAAASVAEKVDSVCYILENDQFVPYQRLSLIDVEEFLPIQNPESEKIILLVACKNQDIKIFSLNDWKLEESSVQFTGGALSEGVSKIRSYVENNTNYLVVSNVRMVSNRINIFRPIFKPDVNAKKLREEILDWAKYTIDRLSRTEVDKLQMEAEILLANLEKKYSDTRFEQIQQPNIGKVITNSLTYRRLNFTTSYWKFLRLAEKAINTLKTEIIQKQKSKLNFGDHNKTEFLYNRLKVGSLVVNNKLLARKINDVDVKNINLEAILAPKIIVNHVERRRERSFDQNKDTESFQDTLETEDLKISGLINSYQWNYLFDKTLKKIGNQTFTAPINITEFQADVVKTANNSVNDVNLENLVKIDSGNYYVNQDIQFAEHIEVTNLFINKRLNHIAVINEEKLDVLLLESNETQIVTGPKIFENLKIIEPVEIAGKLMGSYFDSMTPVKIINENITITGNYTIKGNVFIRNNLSAADMTTKNHVSVRHVLENGIRTDIPIQGVNLKFVQPIDVNFSDFSFVNGFDLQQLVRTNYNEVQIIEGYKHFINSNLSVTNGFAEVKILNGIDVGDLRVNLLTKSGNQTVKGKTYIKNVIADKVESSEIKLNTKDASQFLYKSSDQQIKGKLIVKNLTANSAAFRKVFQLKGTTFNTTFRNPFFQSEKFPGKIIVKEMKISNDINGRSLHQIERLLTQLSGNIKYVGVIEFNHDMTISNLTFNGEFNGIPAKEFVKRWTQMETDQVFTVAQTECDIICVCVEGINIHVCFKGPKFGN